MHICWCSGSKSGHLKVFSIISGRITKLNRIIGTICEQIIACKPYTAIKNRIGIYKSTGFRVIVSVVKIVETEIGIVIIATIAEWVILSAG